MPIPRNLRLLALAGAFPMLLAAQDPTGCWWTPGKGSLIQITADASGRLAGRIVRGPKPGETDGRNPRPELRTRLLLGLTILEGFVQESPRKWKDGRVYDPDSGNTYKGLLWFDASDPDRLNLKGYVGISLFGRTEQWTREVKGPQAP